MSHSHTWQIVSRVKRGDTIEVIEECVICGETRSHLEAT